MKGRDLIRWIQENNAEDLPVMVRHVGAKQKETVTENDLEIKVSIAEGNGQLEYKKYFLI